jgi:hypothetical protein
LLVADFPDVFDLEEIASSFFFDAAALVFFAPPFFDVFDTLDFLDR